MRLLSRLSVLWRDVFGSREIDRQMDEELQFHFDREVQANRERGMSIDEARRAARIAIGNAETHKEASRDERSGALLRQFGRDLAHGTRLFRKSPGFGAACIAVVALGIGAVTAIFSVVNGVLFTPLPYPQANRLVNIWSTAPGVGYDQFGLSPDLFFFYKQHNQVFDDMALFQGDRVNVTELCSSPSASSRRTCRPARPRR
jgi:hypothetical protein